MIRILAATERLALSRARLRQAVLDNAALPPGHDNPLLLAGNMASRAVQTAVRPIAQRNPIGLVLGAAVAGGVLALSRPWRWLFAPAVIASVLPHLVSRMAGSAQPLSWIRLLTSFLRRHDAPGRAISKIS